MKWQKKKKKKLGKSQFYLLLISQLAGVHPMILSNKPDGTFDLAEAESKIRMDDIHFPITRLICVENTHNHAGGKVVPIEFIQQVKLLFCISL